MIGMKAGSATKCSNRIAPLNSVVPATAYAPGFPRLSEVLYHTLVHVLVIFSLMFAACNRNTG